MEIPALVSLQDMKTESAEFIIANPTHAHAIKASCVSPKQKQRPDSHAVKETRAQ